jgi:N,N'-diacetyllegionaminate synthase
MEEKNPIKIGNRTIGSNSALYLIAEVGTTCLGDIGKAKRLIVAAAEAGVDAVKFQLIDPTQVTDRTQTYPVSVNGRTEFLNMREMFERLQFSKDAWREIKDACHACGINFFTTVDYVEGVDMLEEIGVNVHKIGAWDITYRPLIEAIGRTGKPMFVDLGPATQSEVDEAIEWYSQAGGTAVLFMHDFHTQNDKQMNLRTVQYLNSRYPWPAGFSSPARDDDLDMAALALGSAYIEKRLILSRSEPAFHAHESLEPDELKAWVERIRHVERALGRPVIEPSDVDLEGKVKYYRSVCTLKPVKAGEAFTAENIGGRRPGTGIPTKRLPNVYGRVAVNDMPEDHLISEGDFQ